MSGYEFDSTHTFSDPSFRCATETDTSGATFTHTDAKTNFCKQFPWPSLNKLGWLLLLSQDNPRDNFSGSTDPLVHDLNENDPTAVQYSRNWESLLQTPVEDAEFIV